MARAWIPTPEILKKVEDLAALGMQQQNIAWCVSVHPNTFCEKKHDYPELDEAIKKGQARGEELVTRMLIKNIELGKEASIFFYLKERGWHREVEKREQKPVSALISELLDKNAEES
jgi:hypothetical protein